jgi:hypothetical protein
LDHYFNWREGRVLQSYQIILISAGTGTFESAAQPGVQPVEPGTVIVLFPGIWHLSNPFPNRAFVRCWAAAWQSFWVCAAKFILHSHPAVARTFLS